MFPLNPQPIVSADLDKSAPLYLEQHLAQLQTHDEGGLVRCVGADLYRRPACGAALLDLAVDACRKMQQVAADAGPCIT